MNVGELNRQITISTHTETVSGGDVTSFWSTPVNVRAKVSQIDGSRFLKEEELIDKIVYKIQCWDNQYSDNIRVVYNGLTLYPIRPITRNPGKSFLSEITILAATREVPYAVTSTGDIPNENITVDSNTVTVDDTIITVDQ